MSHAIEKNASKRWRVFSGRGFQLRYAFLVAGSLGVLLLFAGFHGIFIATSSLPAESLEKFQPILLDSTLRLFLVGFLYVSIVTLAAIFLSHRLVGPSKRLVREITDMAEGKAPLETLQIREEDDLRNIVEALNGLIERVKRHK